MLAVNKTTEEKTTKIVILFIHQNIKQRAIRTIMSIFMKTQLPEQTMTQMLEQ
ncbi:hypothetical protein [[Mycoplasma] imitans]|uniref:hypothetical protein n=1 Tax=[Mycoplasma] imitans TaxID=29560 RepID=UPI0004B21321|nr:hypothetical protein [[Mycoplasma] imitans]